MGLWIERVICCLGKEMIPSRNSRQWKHPGDIWSIFVGNGIDGFLDIRWRIKTWL
jgi:hypothetical protein